MARWSAYVARRLREMEDGKDEEGWTGKWPSLPVLRAAWEQACDLFPDSAPTPSVLPTQDGCISFVWHKNARTVEVTVDETGGELDVWAPATGEEISGELDDQDVRTRLRIILAELAR
jgi:hypothetical protein